MAAKAAAVNEERVCCEAIRLACCRDRMGGASISADRTDESIEPGFGDAGVDEWVRDGHRDDVVPHHPPRRLLACLAFRWMRHDMPRRRVECELRIECMTLPTSAAEPVLSSDSDRATISPGGLPSRASHIKRSRSGERRGGWSGVSLRDLSGFWAAFVCPHRGRSPQANLDASETNRTARSMQHRSPTRWCWRDHSRHLGPQPSGVSDRIRTCHVRVTNSMLYR